MLKVTVSMMTTMTTVLHGDQKNERSSSPLSAIQIQVACIQGVLGSSRCCCLHPDWVARPCIDLRGNAFSNAALPFQRYSVKVFHIGLRVSLFVHALLVLLVSEIPLHDRSASVLLRGIQVISRSCVFL